MNNEQVKSYLKEYKILCLKHSMFIQGCGCCDSPFLTEWSDKHFKRWTFEEMIQDNARHLKATFTKDPMELGA